LDELNEKHSEVERRKERRGGKQDGEEHKKEKTLTGGLDTFLFMFWGKEATGKRDTGGKRKGEKGTGRNGEKTGKEERKPG